MKGLKHADWRPSSRAIGGIPHGWPADPKLRTQKRGEPHLGQTLHGSHALHDGKYAERVVERAQGAPLLASLTLIAVMITGSAGSTGDEPITPLRPTQTDAAKADLGRKLFHDVRLSGSNAVACASCHRLDRAGGHDQSRPLGADGRLLDYNSPTIFNAALNYRLNWRGNFQRLEDQNEPCCSTGGS
jgi:Di-haem cytochrome c peroxidase